MRINMEGTAAKLNEVQAALFGGSPDGSGPEGGARPVSTALFALTGLVLLAGVGVAVYSGVQATRRKRGLEAWGIVAALGIAVAVGVPLLAFGAAPGLIMARMVWALIVTYLLMAALFESFVYPFVIMISVPLAVVGGFAGLAIVHAWSLADPTKIPQQLDVLTMLGFVILIGVVVNNAILLVHQAINFMRGHGEHGPGDGRVRGRPPAPRRDPRERQDAHPPDLHERADQRGRHAPARALPGLGLGDVPRAGQRRRRRAGGLDRLHARARAAAAEHHGPGDGGAAGGVRPGSRTGRANRRPDRRIGSRPIRRTPGRPGANARTAVRLS
jgi:hypothetical protein